MSTQNGVKIITKHGTVYLDEEDTSLYLNSNPQLISQGTLRRVLCGAHDEYFHRLLLKAGPQDEVDHIDGNPLNNRKSNLRLTTRQQNSWNAGPHKDAISKYKGVSKWVLEGHYRTKPWVAQIKAGPVRYKEYFATEEEAALQYNKWAQELFGEFAYINKIGDTTNFNRDLAYGKNAEKFLLSLYPGKLELSTDLAWDLTILQSNKKIELKVDYYKAVSTKNMFFEVIANDNKQSPGGPFRSLKDGVDFFVYLFWETKELWVFNVPDLVLRINNLKHEYELKTVKNRTYNTLGYAMLKSDFMDLNMYLEDIL